MSRKLELGSGNKPRPGYEHLDFRDGLPHIEYVHDLNNPLPFDTNVFDEVLADNVLVHFPWTKSLLLLIDWTRVLKSGGTLCIVVPDLAHIIQGYINNTGTSAISSKRKPLAERGLGIWNSKSCTIIKIFGGQDYDGNFHFAGFDSELIKHLFSKVGLKNIKTIAKNGSLTAVGTKV